MKNFAILFIFFFGYGYTESGSGWFVTELYDGVMDCTGATPYISQFYNAACTQYDTSSYYYISFNSTTIVRHKCIDPYCSVSCSILDVTPIVCVGVPGTAPYSINTFAISNLPTF